MALTTSLPVINDTDMFGTSAAAAVLGNHRNTLTAHANEGLIRYSINRRTGYRRYSGRDIKRYWRTQA
jgi:DNA-binding transcriptional MerR regulator